MELTKSLLKAKQTDILNRICSRHLHPIEDSDGNIFYISDAYPGIWMEHWFDSVAWAWYEPTQHAVPKNCVRLFLKHQREDGQIPFCIRPGHVFYSQIQECVSIGGVMLDTVALNPDDRELQKDCYQALVGWDKWLCANRMTMKTGLIEQFCGYDTGHDNSGRLDGGKYPRNICPDGGFCPTDDAILPMIVPDMNACFYGDRMAMSQMAENLGLSEEAVYWKKKAAEVKKKLMEICFDEKDCFFYDVDKNGQKRPCKSVAITNVLSEHLPDYDLGREIFERHLHNPAEFWTAYPFPAVSMDDPLREKYRMPNSWGYYSQANTALRTLRWMDYYGFSDEMEQIMRVWLTAWCNSTATQWGQELHPLTGEPTTCSGWYSACMIYSLHCMRRLYQI